MQRATSVPRATLSWMIGAERPMGLPRYKARIATKTVEKLANSPGFSETTKALALAYKAEPKKTKATL
jgi:hypothetical protein